MKDRCASFNWLAEGVSASMENADACGLPLNKDNRRDQAADCLPLREREEASGD
jgi:hypothetical protein